jgi:hypothetical protein
MAEIDINYELKHVSGILSDVETLDLPWSEQELAGFDWFMAVWAVRELYKKIGEMNLVQKAQLEELRGRTNAVRNKLKALGFENPFEE